MATLAGLLTPRLRLRTLTRGDGLLGLRAEAGIGPRGAQVTVAQIEWTYRLAAGDGAADPRSTASQPIWSVPVRTQPMATGGVDHQTADLLQTLQLGGETVELQRDPAGEAEAAAALAATGLRPLPATALQWRDPSAGAGLTDLWSLATEDRFGDFWADEVPRLQALGWAVVVWPGFAHFSVPVERWRLVIESAGGEAACGPQGRWLAGRLGPRPPRLTALRQPPRQGSFMLSLGIDIDGEALDLAPLLADLLKRDARWLDAAALAAIDDAAIVRLRAPGGRRIEAPAGPLKVIVAALLDLLTDPRRAGQPLRLSSWEAARVESLRLALLDAPPSARAGARWELQGETGLSALVERLHGAGTPPPVAAPTGLRLTLRPYQRVGLAWLQYLRAQGLGGILADDMGLGKTAQVMAHLLIEQQAGRLDRPALIVLPTTLIANWQAELANHAPSLRLLTLQGPDRGAAYAGVAGHDVVLTTYPLLWRDLDRLRRLAWHLIVLDEAQMVKNAGSRAAAALRRLDGRHRLCVTGTPLENHLGELWAHFDFLMPGFLGDRASFHRLWRKPIETGGETLRAELLARRVRPFILRRRKEEVATELPPKTEVVRLVSLDGEQRALYESVRLAADEQVRRVLERQGFAGARISILDALLKLRQVCCDPYLVKGRAPAPSMGRAKMSLLREMLPALVSEGRRVLVFSQFTEMLDLIAAELRGLGLLHLELIGDTPVGERGAIVRRFQAGEVPVFLLSLKAGGVGLNLTAADTVIHVDPWWNPAVERQATDRAHRIGQDKPVFVYRLVVAGSIEERMLALQARKSALAEGVLGVDAGASVKFDRDDLAGLLAPLPGQSLGSPVHG